MVADAFAVVDAEAAPALAFGGFEALEEVEEGEGGGGVGFRAGGEGGENWRTSVPVQSLVVLLYDTPRTSSTCVMVHVPVSGVHWPSAWKGVGSPEVSADGLVSTRLRAY